MTPTIVSPRRALYEFIVSESNQMGLRAAIPTPGYLRSDALLTSGQSVSFPIAQDQSNAGQAIGGGENRLFNNDAFYVTDIAIRLYTAEADEAGLPSTNAARSRARLHSFPNTTVFGLNAPECVGLFQHGKFTLKQNDRIYIRNMDILSMNYADTAQEAAGNIPTDAIEGNSGFRNVQDPMIRLNGPSNIECSIALPDNLNFTLVSGFSVYAALIFRGWNVQNGGISRSISA